MRSGTKTRATLDNDFTEPRHWLFQPARRWQIRVNATIASMKLMKTLAHSATNKKILRQPNFRSAMNVI